MSIRFAFAVLACSFAMVASSYSQDGAFPVTVEHALGTITIEAAPERVIALIDRDADTLLALGVQPVAIRSNFGFEAGVGPWSEKLLTSEPIVWTGRELDYEAIAAARPDLIVFTHSGGDEDEYAFLSQIAPTVYLPHGAAPWSATTEQTTLTIAAALGRRDDGLALLNTLEKHLAEQKAAHPEFSGKTANYLDIFPGGIWSYGEYHIVNQTIYALGFSPIAATAQVPEGEANITISAELLPDYDADIVVAFPYGRSFDALLAETPTLDTLTSVKQGRFILLGDLAFSAASVVSIPYAVDQLVPQFAAALAP
ncbi:ABC transporter substrate-binding protein [Devosia sp. 63-57]|uniref:ABC transporter substrate-binding protein n=1 Tax=Devosia sp. 63-57 TaxID=1895751 RepID=UPI00257CF9AB|nr:ABC transporter substrate-binding protein [Devosia sp. 63-57]